MVIVAVDEIEPGKSCISQSRNVSLILYVDAPFPSFLAYCCRFEGSIKCWSPVFWVYLSGAEQRFWMPYLFLRHFSKRGPFVISKDKKISTSRKVVQDQK